MKLGYVIIYVDSVSEATAFYAKAFGLSIRFTHESNMYAEMETGETVLAFADKEMLKLNLGIESFPEQRHCFEIAFTTADVVEAYQKAVTQGARERKTPELKPWGQTVAYVEDPFGNLVELCTPMGLE